MTVLGHGALKYPIQNRKHLLHKFNPLLLMASG